MEVSPKTVEFHRLALMNKLGLHDYVSLTHWALAVGLVQLMFETKIAIRKVGVETVTAVPASIPTPQPPKPKVVSRPKLPKVSPARVEASKPKPASVYKPVVIPPPRKLAPEPSSPFVLAGSEDDETPEPIAPVPEPVKPQPVTVTPPVEKKPLYKAKPMPKDDSWMVTLCERCGKKHTIGWPC